MQKVYAIAVFKEILRSQLEKEEKNVGVFISSKSLLESILKIELFQKFINTLSTTRIRQTVMFLLKFKGRYVIVPEEKIYALDFLNYVLVNNPEIPYDLFPSSDHKILTNFIRNKFLLSISDNFKYTDLGITQKQYKNTEIKYSVLSNNYNIMGFKTKKYGYSFNVFMEKCGIKYIKNKEKIKNRIVIDAGAYDGDSTWILNKFLKPKKILAFEPNKKNFKMLKENVISNNLVNTEVNNLGLGDKKVNLKITPNMGSSAISDKGTEDVKVTTIDSYLQSKIKVGLIKFDIEGFELKALKGAEKTILRDKPTLLISIYHKGQDLFEIPRYLKKLNPSYKFRFVNLDNNHATFERMVIAQI